MKIMKKKKKFVWKIMALYKLYRKKSEVTNVHLLYTHNCVMWLSERMH